MTFYADLPSHQMIRAVDAIIADQTAIIEQLTAAAPAMSREELASVGYDVFRNHSERMIVITFRPDLLANFSDPISAMISAPNVILALDTVVRQVCTEVSAKFPTLGTGIVIDYKNLECMFSAAILPRAYDTAEKLVNAILVLAEMGREIIQNLVNKGAIANPDFKANVCSVLPPNAPGALGCSTLNVPLFSFKATDKVIYESNHIEHYDVAKIIERELLRILNRAVYDKKPYVISNASVVAEVNRLAAIFKARHQIACTRNRLISELHSRKLPIPDRYHEEMEIAIQR